MERDSAIGEAFRKGFRAAWQNLPAILALQGAMAAIVAIYYCWPLGASYLGRYAEWQQSGGILVAALATACAGGILSEISLVYFQQAGHWTRTNLENVAFKWILFFISGAITYEFYRLQGYWFGQGTTLNVLVPKVLVDQFGYTILWAAPFYTLTTRWQALGYSFEKLKRELWMEIFIERFLPILITNWMFWIPGVSLIYSMPALLQTPLFIFAVAIWGLLLPAVTKQERLPSAEKQPSVGGPAIVGQPAE